MTKRNSIRLMGTICIVLGAYVWTIALRIFPYDESKIHAPAWVLLLSGGVFVCAGLAVLLRSHRLLVTALGNLIVIAFGAVAAWVAIAGPSEQFSGGIPLVSHETNVRIARVIFGTSVALCALILIPGIRQMMNLMHEQKVLKDPEA